jgi:D-3-phosphoglycerate dehydrogenase / 2-oxoglutarate reductase
MSAGARVVITQRFIDDEVLAYLHSHGCEAHVVDLPPGKGDADFTEAELASLLEGADGWIVGHAHVSRALLARLPRLQVVARRGVGYDRVDTAAVRDLGKVATIAVGGNDAAVADHAVALMLAAAHRLREGQARLEAGGWSIPLGTDLYRKTVGIVGLGRIGRGVAARLRGFECRVLACTRTRDAAAAQRAGVEVTTLQQVLANSDILTLHVPLTAETRFLLDRHSIATMKRTAIVVNTARGGLVHDWDLLHALQDGRLQGAGLDVFASESDPEFRAATEQLVKLPNVVASPHSGASTAEGLQRTNLIAARSIVAVLQGGRPARECVIADGRTLSTQP